MGWQALCSEHEVIADEVKECTLADGTSVIAVRSTSGEVRVFQGTCPHQQRTLADAYVCDDVLTCSAHMWEFDMHTGEGINGTLSRLAPYPTKVDGDDVFVDTSRVKPVTW